VLAQMVKDKINKNGLSVREAARQIGIANTTVHSVLEGNNVRLDILQKFAEWLDVKYSTLMDIQSEDPMLKKLAVLVEADPRLGRLFQGMIDDFELGKLTKEDVEDIMNYAEFRMHRSLR